MRTVAWLRAAIVTCSAWTWAAPSSALEIVFRDTTPGGMAAPALQAFQQAAGIWTSMLTDPVTVFLDIRYANDGLNGILGSTNATEAVGSYSLVRDLLIADARSAADRQAVSTLAAGSGFGFVASNLDGSARIDLDTNACPTSGPSVPCRNNNSLLSINTANAKALGALVPTNASSPDGSISFNAAYGTKFDFDRRDGITAGWVDFVAVAAHEIGHALGFVSGVDTVDFCTPAFFCRLDNRYGLEAYAFYTPLDLFRYSAPGVRDLRVGVPAGLSIDGGQSFVEGFSTGRYNGDGWQASHFVAGHLNLMNPYAFNGVLTNPSRADLLAFDVIGWDVASVAPIPEPGTWALMLGGLGLVAAAARRRARATV